MPLTRRVFLGSLAAAGVAPPLASVSSVAVGDPFFSFALPCRGFALGWAFFDPWRVDFAGGIPWRVIHETTGVVFPSDRFDELERNIIPLRGIWRDYAPPYRLTGLHYDATTGRPPILREVPAPAFNRAMQEGDSADLAGLCQAALIVRNWTTGQHQPRDPNGAVLVRPVWPLKLRYEDMRL